MAYVDWKIKTKQLSTCSCDYGCPCEFNAPPTRTPCEGIMALEIAEGHFGDIILDNVRVAGVYRWPGPMHEGGGTWWSVFQTGTTPEQMDALGKIFGGEEQEASTGFSIYASTVDHEPEPLLGDIEFEWDLENATGRVFVANAFEASLEPIRNPVTGKPHRAAIKLPFGFEFREAEMASSTYWSRGAIEQNHANRYGFLTIVTYGPGGIIEEESLPKATS